MCVSDEAATSNGCSVFDARRSVFFGGGVNCCEPPQCRLKRRTHRGGPSSPHNHSVCVCGGGSRNGTPTPAQNPSPEPGPNLRANHRSLYIHAHRCSVRMQCARRARTLGSLHRESFELIELMLVKQCPPMMRGSITIPYNVCGATFIEIKAKKPREVCVPQADPRRRKGVGVGGRAVRPR